MSDRDAATKPDGERGRAIQRLQAAVAKRSRLRGEREVAKDSSNEMTADASLRGANDEVAARERWLKSVDEQAY